MAQAVLQLANAYLLCHPPPPATWPHYTRIEGTMLDGGELKWDPT
jgi:hypothetical protein